MSEVMAGPFGVGSVGSGAGRGRRGRRPRGARPPWSSARASASSTRGNRAARTRRRRSRRQGSRSGASAAAASRRTSSSPRREDRRELGAERGLVVAEPQPRREELDARIDGAREAAQPLLGAASAAEPPSSTAGARAGDVAGARPEQRAQCRENGCRRFAPNLRALRDRRERRVECALFRVQPHRGAHDPLAGFRLPRCAGFHRVGTPGHSGSRRF